MARTQQAAQANITLQEQIEAIHKAKGLVGEDETKEKIGPSKPSEVHHPPPIPSAAPILPKPTPPVSAVPHPPSSVRRISRDNPDFSFYITQILLFPTVCINNPPHFFCFVFFQQLPPPVRTTLLSAVPVIPRPPVAPVVRLAPGQVIAPMPPMIPAPRINVVPLPPTAPHIMAPRPPPMVVPAGKIQVFERKQNVNPVQLLNP